ncbi:class I adenylate-forming enzyme family protein [Novosphingopyxis sp.]|uniref:class I adenylate-forming enzyme family protein n=1 Tax=Novosphingopyxis sp. TaxID=2709690 RepID=UPI003B5B6F22
MPSELDRQISDAVAKLSGPGELLETQTIEKDGVRLPYIVKAPETLAQYLAHFCHQHKDTEFLVDGARRMTFGEAYEAARVLAGGLIANKDIAVGDRVGIGARNSANWVIAYMAIVMAGGVATLLNGWWQGGEFAEAIELVGCKLVLVDTKRAARLEGHDLGSVELLVYDNALPPLDAFADIVGGAAAETPLPVLTGDDKATILFTSGSTGRSKGAWSTHRAVVQGTMNYVGGTKVLLQLATERGELPKYPPATLMNVPLFHVTAEVPMLLQGFAMGRKLVLMRKWDAEEAMRLIDRERITYFTGVPLMSIEIAAHARRGDYDLSSCTIMAAGGAPRPAEHVARIKEGMKEGGPGLGYGLTETNGVGCTNFSDNYIAKPDSTGTPTPPLVDLAILDDRGDPVPQGTRGEVCIRSIANFDAYWNDPEATRAAFTDDLYFRTGDIGYVDPDGYLYIVDRKKDIIIRGGENIACNEVESAAYEHDDMVELSVFGIADDRYGEVVGMVYLPSVGSGLTPDSLRAFLEQRLAMFKVPQYIWRADAPLPRLGTQKIDRKSLRADYNAMLGGKAA